MKNIEQYSDYRQYLKEYYDDAKKNKPFFSQRYFSNKAGLKSTGLFAEILKGKRNLTSSNIPGFIKGLGLGEKEAEYFTTLVHFSQAKTAVEKQKYLEEMRGHLPRLKEKIVPVAYYAYYSKWYHIAIRELVCILDWKDDYQLLAKSLRPAIKKREAHAAVQLLLDLKFIEKRNGRYFQTEPHVSTGQEVMSVAIRNVNTQLARMGEEAIQQISPSERDISSLIVGISEEDYKIIKTEIIAFKERIKRISDQQNKAQSVYNMNIQFFPLSEQTQETRG